MSGMSFDDDNNDNNDSINLSFLDKMKNNAVAMFTNIIIVGNLKTFPFLFWYFEGLFGYSIFFCLITQWYLDKGQGWWVPQNTWDDTFWAEGHGNGLYAQTELATYYI